MAAAVIWLLPDRKRARLALETAIGYRTPALDWPRRYGPATGVGNYVAAIALIAASPLSLPLFMLDTWALSVAII